MGCSHWEGNVNAEKLQRVFGVSYPDPKQLKEWEKWQEEAAKRDHRKIGRVRFLTLSQENTCTYVSVLRIIFTGTRIILFPRIEPRVLLFPTERRIYL